jgi:FixJ family two-component response regulator
MVNSTQVEYACQHHDHTHQEHSKQNPNLDPMSSSRKREREVIRNSMTDFSKRDISTRQYIQSSLSLAVRRSQKENGLSSV